MSGVNPLFLFAITQVEALFRDNLGNGVTIVGTGFFLSSAAGTPLFVTNRHNLDPALKLNEHHQLESVRLRLRRKDGAQWTADTRFFPLDLGSSRIDHSARSDVSVVVNPRFLDRPAEYGFYSINALRNLADQAFFASKVFIMDLVSFIGFPGSAGARWWDHEWNTPVARLASLGSWPHVPFSNPSIRTADVTLVTGLSFSGSSGSMVLLHEKGIPPGDIVDPMYAPPKILGIMSGHWWDGAREPEMFRHSGLSYFTRSTSILELLSGVA